MVFLTSPLLSVHHNVLLAEKFIDTLTCLESMIYFKTQCLPLLSVTGWEVVFDNFDQLISSRGLTQPLHNSLA